MAMAEPAPEVAPEPQAEPVDEGEDEGEASIPDEVLMIPEFAGILQGAPPAVTVPQDAAGPEVEVVVKNADRLKQAGIDFAKVSTGDTVVYNTQFIDAGQIALADKKGMLQELAPPWSEVKASIETATKGEPAPTGKVEETLTGAPGPMPKPAPASAMKSVANARIKNVSPSGPSKGAVPGGGRVMNAIMQPVI